MSLFVKAFGRCFFALDLANKDRFLACHRRRYTKPDNPQTVRLDFGRSGRRVRGTTSGENFKAFCC